MANLQVENLVKTYGKVQILKGISLEVQGGEFLSLLGPSGSGKTTILRCIAGLERPDSQSGEIRLGDRKFSGPGFFWEPEKRRLGMVFQNYAVWPHKTVFENVAFPLEIQVRAGLVKSSQLAPKVREALALVRMDHLEARFPAELSGGQQQRVALARALAMAPEILLLDEPLSNLDAVLREELGAEIRKLTRGLGLTTILVTHDQKEALSLSDRIVLLNHGRIDALGEPEALYWNPPTAFAAEFLAGAQRLKLTQAGEKLHLPRKWTTRGTRSDRGLTVEVTTRIFLGAEYEYRARGGEGAEIRFFSPERLEAGAQVHLEYDGTL